MALFGPHMQLLSRAKHSLTAIAQKEICPRDEIADPSGTTVLLVDGHGFAEGFVSFRVLWCAIVAGEICSESCDCLGSATAAGTGRDSVFQVCVLLI